MVMATKGIWGKNRASEPVLTGAFIKGSSGVSMVSGTVLGNLFEWKD